MKLSTTIAIGSILAFSLNTATAETLQGAIQYTVDENPEIQAAKSERLAVEQEISQAKAGYFPTVDIAAGAGREHTENPTTRAVGDKSRQLDRSESSILLRQMLYDGFATASEVERQTARTNSRAYTAFGQAEITALNAVEAYINVLRREELLTLAEENLEVHVSVNDQIVSRSDRGVGRQADVEQSTGRLALAETNLLSEIGNLKDAQTAYLRVVGKLPYGLEPVTAPTGAMPASFDAAVEEAIANHPILKSANSDIESAIAQHATAKTAFMPVVHLELSATHDKDIDGIKGVNEDAAAMVRVRYNVFNGGKDMARRKETAQLINQAKNVRDNTYRQAVESMRLSWIAHQTVQGQMEFFEGHKDASIKSNEAYQKQFNIGRRSLLDLLDSANEMYVAKSDYTNAMYDVMYSQYRILASSGKLNESLGVELPAETAVLATNEAWIGSTQKGQPGSTYAPSDAELAAEAQAKADAEAAIAAEQAAADQAAADARAAEVAEKEAAKAERAATQQAIVDREPCVDGVNGAGFYTECAAE